MFMTYVCAILFNFQTTKCKDLGFIIPPIDQSEQVLNSASGQQIYLDGEKIRLLVWNIYKSEKENWSEDFTTFAKDSDIMLIQEAHLNPLFINTLHALKNYNFIHATSFIFKKDMLATGTLIGSPYVIDKSSMLRTPKTEPFIHTPKTISLGLFPLQQTQEQLLVLNIHGLNATKTSDFEEQINSTSTLLKNHHGPIIFAGDFNTRNKRRTKFLLQFMAKHKLLEVSWNNDQRMQFLGNPLDHVFVKNLKVLKSQVRGDINSSDHKALEVILKTI
jgi:endonuclease/exonuclease/phosphatase (EEP) superfamily protein YafD